MRFCLGVMIALLMGLSLGGCATPRPTVNLDTSFDEALALSMLEAGTNTIEGSALIRQQGGGVVTCAGCDVYLIPVTPYATERMKHIYSSEQGGYSSRGAPKFVPDTPGYTAATRKVLGDAQGNFVFDEVSDGDFYVVTSITWVVGYSQQGGTLMKRVRVEGGESEKIVLSP